MSDTDQPNAQPGKTQLTRPRGIDPKTGKPYEPIDIPVPTQGNVMTLLEKTAKLPDPDGSVVAGADKD